MEADKTAEGYYRIKAIDLRLSFDQDYFEEASPRGTVYALTADGKNPGAMIEVGTFTLDQKTNRANYKFTEALDGLKQYWYQVAPDSSAGFRLMAKQTAGATNQEKISISIDGRAIAFKSNPVIQDGKLFLPFEQFSAEYRAITQEVPKTEDVSLYPMDGQPYCEMESVLYSLGARVIPGEKANTYEIFSRGQIGRNAQAVGNYLMDLVAKQKAAVLYRPTLTIDGQAKEFKVVTILGDGYLKIQNQRPVLVNGLAKPDFNSGKYIFGYFLDENNHLVTDPVRLSQLQTITIANWEYQVFRDGLTLMDKTWYEFKESPKQFSGVKLLKKWESSLDTAFWAVGFNKNVNPFLDYCESLASTVLAQTVTPQKSLSGLFTKVLHDNIRGTLINVGVDQGMQSISGEVKALDLIYGQTITEYKLNLAQRERLAQIVEKTGQKYILSYQDACEFLQYYYQLNAATKILSTSCQVYQELVPESRQSVEGALVNLGKNVLLDKVADVAIVGSLNQYIDSKEICEIINDTILGIADNVTTAEDKDRMEKFLAGIYADLKNEKMKLNYALYNNAAASLSYGIVGY